MSDDTPIDSKTNAAEYTVSEISGALKRTVEEAFGNVRVRGEISGYRGPHSSGHAYFALKDDRARMEAVIWKGTFQRLKFRPEEGMEVIATGRLTTYPGSSKYQIVIDSLEPAGAGALMAMLEERKRRLQAEGLFDPARKQLLPFMPRVIGVITSPTGAVIRDIIHRISDRFPLHVIVWPVRVQGDTTGAEVTAAVEGFNALAADDPHLPRPDVLIVARGGGSLEDLWGFNDEGLTRAVAASDIPVISAVGHETDWTLVDYAADVRAPTPTGAAEMAVPVKAELEAQLASLGARLGAALSRGMDRRRQAVRAAARALPSPDQLLGLPRRRYDEAAGRLGRALSVGTERKRAQLAGVRLSATVLSRRIAEHRRHADGSVQRAGAALRAALRDKANHLARVSPRLSSQPLARRSTQNREALAALDRRVGQATAVAAERRRSRLAQAVRVLSTLSHRSVLDRGFALVLDEAGEVLTRAASVPAAARLSLRFSDGDVAAIASGQADAAATKPRPRSRLGSGGDQGSLF